MENSIEPVLGFFKFEGKLVDDGYLDARKSAETLVGIDEVMRYFLFQSDPNIQKVYIEIPVRIRKGSWEALIPQNIDEWLIAVAAFGVARYSATAIEKMAENDVGKLGLKDAFKNAFKAIKWVIKIASHMGSLIRKQFTNVTFERENGEQLIGIKNDKGEVLYVPLRYLEIYKNCPEKLFSKLAINVEKERELEIGVSDDVPLELDDTDRIVRIGLDNKHIFAKPEQTDILFPELIHNQYVELPGHVSRGNENANTIGFEYQGHILTCYPTQGNIIQYKTLMFTNCIIKGYVDRNDEAGNPVDKRPRIRFLLLTPITSERDQLGLFN